MKSGLAFVVVLATGAPVRAQPAPPDDASARAKAWDGSATKHYDLGEYDAAIAGWRKAYKLFPDPLFLFDIAQAYRLDHDCDDARTAYKSYLRKLPTAANREKVEHFIAEMTACVEDAERKTAREHDLVATVPPPQHHGLRIAGIVTAVAGVVVGSAGIYFSLDASAQAHRIETLCASSIKCDGADVAAIDLRGRRSSRDAIVLYSIGGLALASGIAMTLWADRAPEPVTVTPIPGGATVSTMVRF